MDRKKPMVRINTRISVEIKKWIQKEAKRLKLTEGEVFRQILNQHIKQ